MNSTKAIKQLRYLDKITPKIRLAAEWKKPWQILISTILSAQSRDTKTIEISKILYKKYKTPKQLANAKFKDILKIIKPINYNRTKAKHIKETAQIISKKGIPKTTKELLELPGVGRKVANVYMAVAHKAPAIGVDTHVSRISQKLHWTKNKNPHKIEKDLEKLFPKSYWNSINYILVRFGQTHSRKQENEIFKRLKWQTSKFINKKILE
jgi:endonuclease III